MKIMNSKKIPSNRIINLIIVFILLITLIFLEYNFTKNQKSNTIFINIQSKINSEYLSIKQHGERFTYINNTLSYWTTNSIPIPIKFDSTLNDKFVKLKNGYYIIYKETCGDSTNIYALLIKNKYEIKNKYINNDFNPIFRIKYDDNIIITQKKTPYPIKIDNKTIFYLEIKNDIKNIDSALGYFSCILFFLIFYLILKSISIKQREYSNIGNISLIIIFVVIKEILFYFEWPSVVFKTIIFSPFIYANTGFISSLAELFISIILIYVWISNLKLESSVNKVKVYLIKILVIPISILNIFIIQDVLLNTNKSISLEGIINFDLIIIFVHVIILFLEYVYYKAIYKILYFKKDIINFQLTFIILTLASTIPFFFFEIEIDIFSIIIISISSIFLFICIYYKNNFNKSILLYYMTILILFSIIISPFIFYNNEKSRKTIIVESLKQISSKSDPKAELILKSFEKNIESDSILKNMIINKDNSQIENYIRDNYLYELSINYHIGAIACFYNESIIIQPNSSKFKCDTYFNNRLSNAKLIQNSNNIYLDNNLADEKGYIGYFKLEYKDIQVNLLIECLEKRRSNEMGYPDLLIDDDSQDFLSKRKLSTYGKYIENKLALQIGNINYPKVCKLPTNNWSESNGYLFYIINGDNNDTKWIASIDRKNLYNIISIPSYLFILSSILLILMILIINPKSILLIRNFNIKNSIQLTIIGIFLISFIIFGWISIKYYYQINTNSNRDILYEKTQSICIELEKYYEGLPKTIDQTNIYTINLSNSFLTDINIYDTNGYLTNTSRQSIFSQGLTSQLMVKSALDELKTKQTPILIREEKIGLRNYTSSYMPIKNTSNITIAYLHIPFIIQQKDIENKTIEFVSSFSNIYVIWIIISLIIAYTLSNYITLPLKQIKDKLKQININQINEKINWKRDDELGELIISFNSMIDKLEYNTFLLKRSEREDAWRELAKQVAHDIKNPLTPMKLSIQQLQRLQKTDIAKFHERFEYIAPALVEQINTLSDIASEFSDYSKTRNSTNQIANINECIKSAIDVYLSNDDYEIILKNDSRNNYYVLCDKQQLIRIFNNLIKNSIQALDNRNNGIVEINIKEINNECIISISDNGIGIAKENYNKIFSSKFTTKIDGTGIGLSIVKGILESIGGKIYFDSKVGSGTIFTIHIPIVKQ
ncbi:MAG: hypothetical protein H6Q15_2184 [Bacteroidetes bacterium]|nr:hypothetical protein [Bacteroidota bacterium]